MKNRAKTLAVPVIFGMDENNVLDKSKLSGDISVSVPFYESSIWDVVTLYFGAYSQTYLVENIINPIIFKYKAEEIPVGDYDVYYTTLNGDGDKKMSSSYVKLKVIESVYPARKLPTPSVEGSGSGVLNLSSLNTIVVDITSDSGNLQMFDVLQVYIQNVAGTSSHSKQYIVRKDINSHPVSFDAGLFSAGYWRIFYMRLRGGVEEVSAILPIKFVGTFTPPAP